MFDPNFPCAYCEQPVQEECIGGTAICPWCDCGMNRDGSLWDYRTMKDRFANYERRISHDAHFRVYAHLRVEAVEIKPNRRGAI